MKWTSSAKIKKWLWSCMSNLRVSSKVRHVTKPKTVFTFFDCFRTHNNTFFTGVWKPFSPISPLPLISLIILMRYKPSYRAIINGVIYYTTTSYFIKKIYQWALNDGLVGLTRNYTNNSLRRFSCCSCHF